LSIRVIRDVMEIMPKLVLFDIDGTLVLTGGAGVRAMTRACEEIVGLREALEGVQVAGRTDWIILHDAMKKIGRELDEDLFAALRDGYLARLREEIALPGRGVKGVMPGVRALLDELQERDHVFLGLLTGNFEEGARIKLEHFDLWRYFRSGAFGGDSADRNALVPFALRRARASGLADLSHSDILVVGDTPHDVACAQAVGAVPVGVATGGYSVQQLRQSGAEIVFEDLRGTEEFLALIDPA
jgi:phosphoglycolate phosphatase-like HAD superfamily hydrolase